MCKRFTAPLFPRRNYETILKIRPALLVWLGNCFDREECGISLVDVKQYGVRQYKKGDRAEAAPTQITLRLEQCHRKSFVSAQEGRMPVAPKRLPEKKRRRWNSNHELCQPPVIAPTTYPKNALLT